MGASGCCLPTQVEPLVFSPTAFAAFMTTEALYWARAVQAAAVRED